MAPVKGWGILDSKCIEDDVFFGVGIIIMSKSKDLSDPEKDQIMMSR